MWCVEKASSLKLYLPRHKWTMNETLISLKYVMCWKSIKSEAVFTKTQMNNEWNINFFKKPPWYLAHLFLSTFPLVIAGLKILFCIGYAVMFLLIFFWFPFNLIIVMSFHFRKQENITQSWRSGKYDEAPVMLELWRMCSSPLPSLLGAF